MRGRETDGGTAEDCEGARWSLLAGWGGDGCVRAHDGCRRRVHTGALLDRSTNEGEMKEDQMGTHCLSVY